MATVKRLQLEQRYASLLDAWILPGEERQAVLALLLEADMADTDHGMRLAGAEPAERVRLTEELNELKLGIDNRLQATLGPEHYTEFSEFKAALPIHLQIDNLSQRLAGTGEPLTTEQNAALFRILADARTAAAGKSVDDAMNGATPGVIDEAAIASLQKLIEQENDTTATHASAVLSPAQLGIFRQIQSAQAAGVARGLEFLKDR